MVKAGLLVDGLVPPRLSQLLKCHGVGAAGKLSHAWQVGWMFQALNGAVGDLAARVLHA